MNPPQDLEAPTMTGEDFVQGAKQRWESLLSSDREQMTAYERIEMDQDVAGRNVLAALSPDVTTNLGLKGLKKELERLRQLESDRQIHVEQAAITAHQAEVSLSSSSSKKRPLSSPTVEHRILHSAFIVENEETLLRFIRADRLDAQKAAQRMVNYYSLAMELFGDAVLNRPIFLNDLNKKERKILESGWLQLLLARDVHGRRITTMDQVGPANPGNIEHK
ncbi:MAG: hypothetical protein SGILL_007898, partial [Bacillariaceae sp.]